MRSRFLPGFGPICLFCLLSASLAAASVGFGDEFERRLQAAVQEEGLSVEDALLHRFRYVFAPANLPPELQVPDPVPRKCATALIRSYRESAAAFSRDAAAEIDVYLQPTAATEAAFSPTGRFHLEYAVSGVDAVPSADVDPADGVPDYVQHIGEILEEAWEAEFVRDGFVAPIPPVAGPYPVSFRDMAAYGFTQVVDTDRGATRIILHNDYEEFPPNNDPEGDRWGAARAAAAHELKHASQYATSRWSEGGWIEVDAVWAEERVFDQVNDYYQYLTGESPLRQPELPLDAGASGTGSYEDVVWQIWLQETWGVSLITDFWQRRAANADEPYLEAWRQVLAERDATWPDAWAQFTGCNYGTDERAVLQVGYEEAVAYPCGPASPREADHPVLAWGAVEHLAAYAFRLDGFATTVGADGQDRLEITLQDAGPDGVLTLAVHTLRRDGTGSIEIAAPAKDGVLRHRIAAPWGELESVGIIVGNAALAGDAAAFALIAERVDPAAGSPVVPGESPLAVTLEHGSRSVRDLELINLAGEPRTYAVRAAAVDPRLDSEADTAPGWLTCDCTGSLESEATGFVTLHFDAAVTEVGAHLAWLEIRTDGFSEAEIVPVTLEVTPEPALRFGRLRGSHPNPFNPVTWLEYELPAAGAVRLAVLDLRGRVVRTLVDGVRESGFQRASWDGRDDRGAPLGAGVYLARLRSGGGESTCKMILAK